MWDRERITITEQDEPSAIVISAEELEDLEDALAVAQSRLREADGETALDPAGGSQAPPWLRPVTLAVVWEPVAVDLATSFLLRRPPGAA